jgi:uncharacterized membrane protein YfcA
MTSAQVLLIIVAGISAGVINAVVGAGTLVTFPTLLLLGFPPVIANVSNTVGLVPGSIMASIGYRSTLRGRGPVVRRLLVATSIGGLTGGALLVLLPGRAFDTIVPWLLLIAALLAALQPRIAAAVALRRAAQRATTVDDGAATVPGGPVGTWFFLGILLTGIYGGYFGAAQGVMLLVILGLALGGPLNELNGIKNILGGTANLVSALLFIAIAEVDWSVAGLVAVGATIGGGLGGRYGRRLPSSALRVLLVVIAVVAAAVRFVG